MFLVCRNYKPKLKPAGPRIAVNQPHTAFSTCTSTLRTKTTLLHKNDYSNPLPHFLLCILLTYQLWFYFVAWFLITDTARLKLWSLPVTTGRYFFHRIP